MIKKQLIIIKRHLLGIVKAIENLIAHDKTKGDQNGKENW